MSRSGSHRDATAAAGRPPWRPCQAVCPVSLPHLGQYACVAESGVVDGLRAYPEGATILAQGSRHDQYYVVAEGWVCLSSLLSDGRRRVLGFALPGELVGFSFDAGEELGYGAEALTAAVLCPADKRRTLRALQRAPALWLRVSRHLLWAQFLLHATRLAHLGAQERLANLLYSLFLRLENRPAQPGDSVALPVSQQVLADAVGLSLEHASRTRKLLRRDGVLTFERGRLTIFDPAAVAALAGFDADEVLRRLHGLSATH